MTTREELINQFIEEHGQFIKEECERQKGNNFFLEQIWSDNMTDEVYELTEDGQGLVLLSEAEAKKFKKSFKKDEIRNKINYGRIKRYIQPFQIIRAHFPFTNKPNQYSERPILVVPISRNEYRFMMVTTGAYTDVIYRRYEVLVRDWKEAGLDHSSYARTNIVVDEDGLFFTSRFKIYGALTNSDILGIMKTLKSFREETFTNPIAFMYWLISHKVNDTIARDGSGNNNTNQIQSIYDIEESEHANCVDLAIAVYKMCNNHREFKPSTIGTVSWIINDHRSDGHVFTLFKYKGNTYVFWYNQSECVGSFPNYKSQSFENAAVSFCSEIKKDHPHYEVRSLSLKKQLVYVLDKYDLNNAEDTSKYSNQIEWLQDYSALYRTNKQRSLIQGKFYRVSYNGEGVYEALRKKVGWDWKTVKQDPDINWLPTPQVKEYKNTYRSFFTTLGYKTFQAKTMKVIDKYLDPKKIKVNEYNDIHGILMYKDQYQVVVDQGDEVMNEKFGVTTMDDLVALRRDFSDYVEDKLTPKPDNVVSEEAEYGTNWFISEDDIYLNWDKWEDGSSHLVFVNGLSGSGKSTLGRKISENYDAYYVELDVYGWGLVGQKAVDKGRTNFDYIKEKDRKLYEYMKAKGIRPDIFAKIDKWNFTKEEEQFKVGEIEKYLHWLAFEQDERVVVEGGYTGVVMVRNPEMWKDTPIIFKGTSVTKSIFRRMVRTVKKDGPIGVFTVLKAIKPQYLDHMIPETNDSRKAMLSGRDDWEYVEEAFGPTITMYHGSYLKFSSLKPLAYNGGTRFGKPSFSVFMWSDWNLAFKWAIFVAYKMAIKKRRKELGLSLPLGRHTKIGFNKYDFHCYIKYNEFDQMKQLGMEQKIEFYVYTVKVPVNRKFGLGNNNFQPEYTYDGELPIYKREKFTMTEEMFNNTFSPCSLEEYDELRDFDSHQNIRGPIGWIFRPSNEVMDEWIWVTNQIHSGDINPEEDDMDEIIKKYHDSLHEAFTQIEADKSPHNRKKKLDLRKIPTKIADFKDFLKKIKNPEMVMKWFLKVKVRWTPHGGSNDHPFQWPDWLIKQRMGNCFDQSIFLHYFCRAKHIDHKMYLVTWLADNGQGTGHAVPLYKKGDNVYVFAYLNPKMGFIGGPFRSYGEAKRVLDNYFLMYINQFFKAPSTPYSSYLSDDDLANFDKYYNNRKITQTEYIIEGLGKNMRSSHMFKIKVKGFAFPNPILPAYDCIVAVFRTISMIYNFFAANEEVDIDYGNEDEVITEEEQLTEDDWIHDPSLLYRKSNKRKFDKIKNFNQFCNEIDTPEEALSYFIIEKVRWSSMEEMTSINRPFYWPDDIIRGKIGVCMDQTLLMHQFYDYKGIENKSGFMIWVGEDNKDYGSHIVPMFKRNGRIYCTVYLPNIGWIHGPFDSWTECVEETAKALASCSDLVQGTGKKIYTITEVVPDEFMKEADECSRHRKDITWYKFVTEDGCRRIRNTKLLNLHYKSISIWNPIISVWNVIRFLRNNFGLDIPYYGLEEETTLLEEKLSADERRCFGLPKKKKYPMPDEAHVRAAIRFFNHCDPEDEEELARNIKKYMKKYNMKDVNVSDNNRFKKYYHPEEAKEEKKPIQESGTYQDTLFVYNRLSDKEKSLLGRHHVDSPACVYRKVEYSNNTPTGWIELYDSSKVAMMTNQEYDENIKDLNIGIAVDKEFRGKGVATKLIKGAVQFFKSSQYETLTYIVRDGNDRSEAFAKKCGFAYMWRRKKEHETIYMITNPTKMRNAINEAYLYIRASVNAARRSLGLLETSAAMGGPVVGMEINDQTVSYSNPGMFMIQYSDGNDTGYGITNDLKTKYFLRHDKKKNKLVKEDFSEFLKDKYFGIYSITQEHRDLWNNLLTSFYEDPKCLTEDFRTLSLYEYFSGRRELVGDQIDYDENFNRIDPLWLDLMYNMKLQDPKMMNIPVINENYNGGDLRKHITLPQGIREFVSSSLHSNELVLCEDPKGMYLLDENNNLVSRYITQEELEVINDGISCQY